MSLVIIRQQLEQALAAMTPAIDTVWENTPYVPVEGTPFQRCNILFAEPDNPTLGDGFYRERGLMQVMLCYPLQTGSADANARAQLIRTAFPQGRSFVSGKITTIIERTAAAMPGGVTAGRSPDDRFTIPMRVRFFSNVLP